MFNEKQDVFEYPSEKPDWKYPKYVELHKKGKKNYHQGIEAYNEEVTRQNLRYELPEEEEFQPNRAKLLKG